MFVVVTIVVIDVLLVISLEDKLGILTNSIHYSASQSIFHLYKLFQVYCISNKLKAEDACPHN